MAATRLSDSQKIEIVARYRAGEGSSELAGAFGCSAITVSRAVKAAL
ncbi:MAG: helix-turn-helix domain-containing protein, partial [Cyanobacteria bacterium]|nr:helix-turn-helix domain-containing protein [Cyanobacteriota bacterium]